MNVINTRKALKRRKHTITLKVILKLNLPSELSLVPCVVFESYSNSVYLQIAVMLMLCGLQTEQLLPGQRLMVKQINNKLDGDAAAVKLAEVQICTERREINWRKSKQAGAYSTLADPKPNYFLIFQLNQFKPLLTFNRLHVLTGCR